MKKLSFLAPILLAACTNLSYPTYDSETEVPDVHTLVAPLQNAMSDNGSLDNFKRLAPDAEPATSLRPIKDGFEAYIKTYEQHYYIRENRNHNLDGAEFFSEHAKTRMIPLQSSTAKVWFYFYQGQFIKADRANNWPDEAYSVAEDQN